MLLYRVTRTIKPNPARWIKKADMTPEQQAIIINDTVHEIPQVVTGCKLGVTQQAISKQKANLLPWIQLQATEFLTRGLVSARRSVCRIAALGNTKRATNEAMKLSLDASKVILNAAGILSSPSTVINNMVQVNQNQVPEQLRALLQQVARNDQNQVIDVEK